MVHGMYGNKTLLFCCV